MLSVEVDVPFAQIWLPLSLFIALFVAKYP